MSGFPCPICGRTVRRSARGRPRKIVCPRCRYRLHDYPRPCAGMVVVKGDTTLMLVRAHEPRKGRLDTPGGFIEAGESIEGAARRELLEETGLRVGRVTWLGFYWDRYYLKGFGYLPTMNFYYLARWRSGTPRPSDDAATATWMPIAALHEQRARFSWKHMDRLFRDVKRAMRR